MATILLLEPDRLLARSYKLALERNGHTVHWQTDAEAALGVMDAHNPDLIILELQLANHNGVEFLYEIRSYPDWDRIPVLLHTMVPPSQPGLGRQLWPQLGIHEYLYKPQTSLAQLNRKVNRLTAPQLT
jgi:DNA-binding response OmpR family regulator